MYRLIVSAILLAHLLPLRAQDLPNALLWKVSQNNSTNVSYLFGTIHMIGEENFYIPDTIVNIIQNTDQLCFELNIDNSMEMMMGLFSMGDKLFLPDNKTIEDYLTQEEFEKFNQKFKDSPFPFGMIKRLKPLFILAMLDGESDTDFDQMKSYEMELSKIAQVKGIETCGLEKVSDQLKVFDQIPIEDQVRQLMHAVEDAPQTENNPMDSLVYHYTQQDLNKLDEMIEGQFYLEDENYADLFLGDRNKRWVDIIENNIRDSVFNFYAVGAGHLPGKDGLIELLLQKGYSVDPVHFDWNNSNNAEDRPKP
jgi:uncharacterized protein YbaP (TraB family)